MSERDVEAAKMWTRDDPEVQRVLARVRFKRTDKPEIYDVMDGDTRLGYVERVVRETYRKYKGDRLRYPSGSETVWDWSLSYNVSGRGEGNRATAAACLIRAHLETSA